MFDFLSKDRNVSCDAFNHLYSIIVSTYVFLPTDEIVRILIYLAIIEIIKIILVALLEFLDLVLCELNLRKFWYVPTDEILRILI